MNPVPPRCKNAYEHNAHLGEFSDGREGTIHRGRTIRRTDGRLLPGRGRENSSGCPSNLFL